MFGNHRQFWLLLVAGLCQATVSSAMADVWYVSKASVPGGDGTSWALAFQTIQPAIDAAFADGGGEVWIAAGLYDEVREPQYGALLLRENVEVYGGFSGGETQRSERDWNLHKVEISGEHGLAGGLAVHTVRPESSCRLDGVTVTRASEVSIWVLDVEVVTLENIHFLGGNADGFSRGLFAQNVSSLLIRRCLIDRCVGGLATSVFDVRSVTNSQLKDSIFIENSGSVFGGAVILSRCEDFIVEGCIFRKNSAMIGGAMYINAYPGGLCDNVDSFPEIRNCLFVGNSATVSGGAIDAYLTEVFIDKGFRECTDCGFCGSDYSFATPILSGCTFAQNTAGERGGAISANGGRIPGVNNIFFENSDPAFDFPDPKPFGDELLGGFTYSNLQECDDGEGNTCADPQFVDAEAGDFRLKPGSPCIDSGKTTNTPFYDFSTQDILAAPRGVNGRTGEHGDGSNYDMGAYEYVPEGEVLEGEPEGEGTSEGEGTPEGEEPQSQSADQDGDFVIALSELLRVIQFYNVGGLHCADTPGSTEDGYLPGAGLNLTCSPHSTDYNPQDWKIDLSELLRAIQFYNIGGYAPCVAGEDGFCPGQ